MDIFGILNGIWLGITDDNIIPAIQERLIFFGVIVSAVGIYVKRSKSTWDNEFFAALKDRFGWNKSDDDPV